MDRTLLPTSQQKFSERSATALQVQAGIGLLAAAFLVGCLLVYYGNFVDESDNLAVGALLARGYSLYSDLFSHHFPFPYYWVAALTRLFGVSVLAARLSIVGLQTTCFALVLHLTRQPVAAGLGALAWAVLGHFNLGNLVIYYTFSANALLVIFAIIYARLTGRSAGAAWEYALLGACAAMAFLSDPLMLYPLAVAGLALLLQRTPLRSMLLALTVFAGISLVIFAPTLINAGWRAFYRDAIAFNLHIYAKFGQADPQRMGAILGNLGSGLCLLCKDWWNLDPFWPLLKYKNIDQWFFTGFFFRLAVLSLIISLLRRRRFLLAGFVYVFAAALLVHRQTNFQAMPFNLFSLLAAALVITTTPLPRQVFTANGAPLRLRSVALRLVSWSESFLRATLMLFFFFLLARGLLHIVEQRQRLTFWWNFGNPYQVAERVNRLTCSQVKPFLAYYPDDPLVYYFSGLPPVARYVYMWPWVAEIAQTEVLNELRTRPVIAYIKTEGSIRNRPYTQFLGEYLKFVRNNYIQTSDHFFFSPKLLRQCVPATE